MYDLLPRLRSVRNLWANECWTFKLWLHSGIEVRCTKYDFNQASRKFIYLMIPPYVTHCRTHVLITYEMLSTVAVVSAHFPRIFPRHSTLPSCSPSLASLFPGHIIPPVQTRRIVHRPLPSPPLPLPDPNYKELSLDLNPIQCRLLRQHRRGLGWHQFGR